MRGAARQLIACLAGAAIAALLFALWLFGNVYLQNHDKPPPFDGIPQILTRSFFFATLIAVLFGLPVVLLLARRSWNRPWILSLYGVLLAVPLIVLLVTTYLPLSFAVGLLPIGAIAGYVTGVVSRRAAEFNATSPPSRR